MDVANGVISNVLSRQILKKIIILYVSSAYNNTAKFIYKKFSKLRKIRKKGCIEKEVPNKIDENSDPEKVSYNGTNKEDVRELSIEETQIKEESQRNPTTNNEKEEEIIAGERRQEVLSSSQQRKEEQNQVKIKKTKSDEKDFCQEHQSIMQQLKETETEEAMQYKMVDSKDQLYLNSLQVVKYKPVISNDISNCIVPLHNKDESQINYSQVVKYKHVIPNGINNCVVLVNCQTGK